MATIDQFEEKRRYPRMLLDVPLEYRVMDVPYAHGGIVVNISESGLLIYSDKDMSVGLRLHIAVLFPKAYELTHFDVTAEIVWKDRHVRDDSEGYVYGIEFIQMFRDDRWKINELVDDPVDSHEVSPNP